MIYFTSDTHFGHANVIKYCNRPYATSSDMNFDLIKKWNETVMPNDEVYHLGDFALTKPNLAFEILSAPLNGKIHLIRGNHDSKDFLKKCESKFVWIKDYYELKVPDEEMGVDQVLVLFHYPIGSWNHAYHGSWHLHGHCHGTFPSDDTQPRLDVGVDCHGFKPISYDEVKAIMTKKVFKPVDHHGRDRAKSN